MPGTPDPWPAGFPRVPDESWTREPVAPLARGYDEVTRHSWYDNLEATVEELLPLAEPGAVVVDYSGGTGALTARLLERAGDVPLGVLNVDASAKFLRLALERFRDDPRVALRRLRWLEDEGRLERVDEVLDGALASRGVDALACANAVHLYPDLRETFASWTRVLRPGARVLVQSGNIARPSEDGGAWIIDETVEAVHDAALEIVRRDPRYKAHRPVLDDAERMARYDDLRRRFFLPVRPLDTYLDALHGAGLEVDRVAHRPVAARVDEWTEFLAVYHEGVLPWVGGSERVGDPPASEEDIADRVRLIEHAVVNVFGDVHAFDAEWTYITCTWPG